MPIKRASEGAGRAAGAIERLIERTLAPRLEEIAGEVRGIRGEMQQMDRRITESVTALRNETVARIDSLKSEMNRRFESVNSRLDSLSSEVNSRFESVNSRFDSVNVRIDALNQRLDDALNIRERLVALEARFEASQKRNGA